MIAAKAVIFTHLPLKMPDDLSKVNEADYFNDKLMNRVKPIIKRYLVCRNIGLVYLYVDVGIRCTLKHLIARHHSSGAVPIHYTLEELAFEESVRNCIKLAIDMTRNELILDPNTSFKKSDEPIIQLVGLPHLLSLINALHKIDNHLVRLIAGENGDLSYDAPKFVEAVIRIARSRSNSSREYPIFRLDEDVFVNEDAIIALLVKVYNVLRLDQNQYQFFSGGYGKHGHSADPFNDYAVRTHWLIDKHKSFLSHGMQFLRDLGEIGATQVGTDVAMSASMDTYLYAKRGGKTANRAQQQVISGAGLYMTAEAIRCLPPFMNFDTFTLWVDDHLKRRLHEVLGHILQDQIEHVPEALFPQNRHPGGIEQVDIDWAKDKYFERLLAGCIGHALITKPEGNKGVVSKYIDSYLETQSLSSSEPVIREEIHKNASQIAEEILDVWQKADYGNNILQTWALHYDPASLVGKLTDDFVEYITLVSRWHQYVTAIDRLQPVKAYWLFRNINISQL